MFHDRVKSSDPLPIDSRDRLVLISHGDGNDARFANLFREAWFCLPLSDRRTILTHWRDSRWSDETSPRIELLNGWTEPILTRNFKPKVSRALGQCSYAGQVLRFHAAVVDPMPDIHVRELVGHELSHVYLMARGDFSGRPICEIRADLQMTRWGFDPFAMDEWIHRHIRGWRKDGRVLWHDPPLARSAIEHLLGDWSDGRFHPRYLSSRGHPVRLETWNRAVGTVPASPTRAALEPLHGSIRNKTLFIQRAVNETDLPATGAFHAAS